MTWAFEETACCRDGCGEVIVTHQAVEARRRRTGEWFYCPAGHRQHYIVGKTDEQKKIEQLGRLFESRERQIEQMRVAAGRCPWVGCEFRTSHVRWRYGRFDLLPLWTHMRAAHGMPTLAEVEEAHRDDDAEVAS